MADNIRSLQLRMNTVDQVSKITNAMKLVSLSKLQKYQRLMNETQAIVDHFEKIPSETVTSHSDAPILAICFAPDLGMSSQYNLAIQAAVKELQPDAVLWVGNQLYERLKRQNAYNFINEGMISSDNVNLEDVYDFIFKHKANYQVMINWPEIVGDEVVFEWRGLSLAVKDSAKVEYEASYEDANKRYQEMLILLTLYGAYYQAKYGENMMRRIAMEQATDNANEMREELNHRYNQLRQEQITQEIQELSAGVDSK